MPRLLPCPTCGSHVRVTEVKCPFCGGLRSTTLAPGLLTIALLGLSLVGCTTKQKQERPAPDARADADDGADPRTAERDDPPAADRELATAGQPDEREVTGNDEADAGADVEGVREADETRMKPMYGGPRPRPKYGAPRPKPDLDDPWGE
jgi:hypothetical protein